MNIYKNMNNKENEGNRTFIIFIKIFLITYNLYIYNLITKQKLEIQTKKKLSKESKAINPSNSISDNNDNNVNDTDIINKYISNIKMDEFEIENKRKEELKNIIKYKGLKDVPKDPNDPLIEKERKIILNNYFKTTPISDINIYYDFTFSFGNQLAAFNKLIFYCEIIHCSKIYLSEENNLFINHTLYDKEHNLKIQVGLDDFFNVQVLSSISPEFFYDFYTLKIDNRVDIFKKEILNNLPKVKISKNDLIIHFRSSDIFQHVNDSNYAPDYAQPPLCFYETILQKFKFDKIYIISADDIYNPVIKKLRKKYPRIVYHNNPLDVDISFLARGYKIVGSISSFLISSIKLNNNLKYLWEYDIYPMSGKLYHFHHLLFNIKRKYIIYQMKPSNVYKNKMIVWKCSKEQLKIMLNDKCSNNFKIIKPNVT